MRYSGRCAQCLTKFKRMKAKTFIYGICLFIMACAKTKNESPAIKIDLQSSVIDNPFSKALRALQFFDSIPQTFKGVINRDSSFLMRLNTVNQRDLKENVIVIDSARTKLYALSGYHNGKQYFILDLNGNKNFGDDEIIEFDKEFTNQKDYRDFFDIHPVQISTLEGNYLNKQQMFYQFLPAPDYFSYKEETEKEKFKHSLQLAALQHNFLYGTFQVEDSEYGIGVNKGWSGYEFIFKKSDTVFYSRNHQSFAKYEIQDTVKIHNKYFTIDSISGNPPQVTLNEIDIKGILYGFRTNEISKNYQITSLEGDKTTLKDIAGGKSLILLDFWGTWCAPCKELTPELVKLNKKHGDEVQFVSLAFEMDSQPVKKYVIENDMNWYNGIIKGKPKSGDMSSPVLGGLRIECYPTFIVLNSDLKILFRTCGGGDNFLNLQTFLDAQF